MNTARAYRMTQRRESVEHTRDRILQAAYDTWLQLPYDQVTLDAVAAAAGVSRQTILRHFGSKDDLAVAVVAWQRPIEEDARAAEPGDTTTAVRRLVDRYETMGDANVRVLELEGRVAPIDRLLSEARASHRGWIERTFAPWVGRCRGARREELVLALYAATDVTVWKLLRRDLGGSRARVESIIHQLVEGVLRPVEPTAEEETS
jgi:AcrR family transcriptional regulator